MFEDNNGAIKFALSPRITTKTRHIATKYHFFRRKLGAGKYIQINRTNSKDNITDIFNEGLKGDIFTSLWKLPMEWKNG